MKISFSLILIIMVIHSSIIAQVNAEPVKTALLIVDIQDFYFPGDGPGLVNAEPASRIAKEVLQIFREKKQEVVHIRHQSEKGFSIHQNVLPLADEKVITKTEVNSFLHTDLLEYLRNKKVTRLVIIGMQTHMCLEAAVRAAYDFGFDCVVISDACATKDLTFEGKTVPAEEVQTVVFATITKGGYGKVIDFKSFKKNSDTYIFKK